MTDLAELMEEIDLEEWLDAHAIDFKRTSGGDNLNLKSCPFCGSDEWRVYMSRSKKLGLCFRGDCNRKFNLFSLARQHLDADNRNTIRALEAYTGTQMRAGGALRCAPVAPPAGDWTLPESVPLPTSDGMTHPYLLERGILLETQQEFGLRWCEAGVYAFEDAEGRAKKMWFGNRILHPICDLDGAMATFVGRDATKTADIRYLFPPLLPSAGRHFYGGERLPGRSHIVVGEGPYDAIAIHQAIKDHPDFRGVAATASFGLSIGAADPSGDDQLGRLLKLKAQGLQRVTLMWDGEAKALRAALLAAETLSRHGIVSYIATLPEDTDPAEVETRIVREAIEKAARYTPALRIQWELASPYAHREK